MKAQEIERTEFAGLSLDSARMELAEKAASTFGYKKLQGSAGGTLIQALRNLDIAPLVTSQVERYKKSKEKTSMWSGRKWGLFDVLLTILIFGACSVCVHYQTLKNVPKTIDWVTFSGLFVFGLLTLIMVPTSFHYLLTDGQDRGRRTRTFWKRYTLDGYYPGLVPEFAMVKAIAIQNAVPNATLQIDHLMTETDRAEMNARERDPFLLATLGEETYYVEVWDEKDYEKLLYQRD